MAEKIEKIEKLKIDKHKEFLHAKCFFKKIFEIEKNWIFCSIFFRSDQLVMLILERAVTLTKILSFEWSYAFNAFTGSN